MDKYMKKSTVTEVSPQQAMAGGVSTRAKTLALQQSLLPAVAPATDSSSSLSFLEVRSRRLQKPPPPLPKSSSKQQQQQPSARKCCPRASRGLTAEPGSFGFSGDGSRGVGNGRGCEAEDCAGASFGENILESHGRTTRESTPCSFIRDPDSVPTLTSTTRSRRATSRTRSHRVQNDGEVPRLHEMEEIFDCVEDQQRVSFLNKYNFDIAKDQPLPGRFEWVPVV